MIKTVDWWLEVLSVTVVIIVMIVMMMVPIYVTLLLKVIEHGDDVHSEQHPNPPSVEHVTSNSGVDNDDDDDDDKSKLPSVTVSSLSSLSVT